MRTGSVGVSRVETALGRSGQSFTLSLIQVEQLDGVIFEDEWPDFVADGNGREVGKPAVRRNERIVRAEHNSVFEPRVGILHELGREIFGGPAGRIDINVRLVKTNGNRFAAVSVAVASLTAARCTWTSMAVREATSMRGLEVMPDAARPEISEYGEKV